MNLDDLLFDGDMLNLSSIRMHPFKPTFLTWEYSDHV